MTDGLYTEGQWVTVGCDAGYGLWGHPIITCQSSGNWNGASPSLRPLLPPFFECLGENKTIFQFIFLVTH